VSGQEAVSATTPATVSALEGLAIG
jgi:hypothetical protein